VDSKPIVIASRKDTESRRLANAADLDGLVSNSWNVSLVTLGIMTFLSQLHVMADAKVLVGVSGSDLVSLLFMPFKAAVIEILPLVLGTPVFCPELANQARNSGKVHRPYYSPYNATLFEDAETGEPIQARPIHQAKLVTVHVPSMVAHIQGAVQLSDAVMFYGLSVHIGTGGRMITCGYDHPAPKGLLYGCTGVRC